MARLRFAYGTMASGKSSLALQTHHDLSGQGLKGLLCTQHDRHGARVSSRLGVSARAVEVGPRLDLYALAVGYARRHGGIDYVVCDEAQFYTPDQVEQLALVVDRLDADVCAFGLLTDFRSRLFPGSARFLELADERQALPVEARCWCGRRATMNARLVHGRVVYDGAVVAIGDTSGEGELTYELLCRRHWRSGETARPVGAGDPVDRAEMPGVDTGQADEPAR